MAHLKEMKNLLEVARMEVAQNRGLTLYGDQVLPLTSSFFLSDNKKVNSTNGKRHYVGIHTDSLSYSDQRVKWT